MIGLPRELAVETRAYPMGASEGFEGLGGAWMTHGWGVPPEFSVHLGRLRKCLASRLTSKRGT